MKDVRIVHLSDIHFGQLAASEARHIHTDVRDELLNDLDRLRKDSGPANALAVTGDIAFSGAENEYREATKWLDDACSAAGCSKDQVYTVPGNHDIDRSRVGYVAEVLHDRVRRAPEDMLDSELGKLLSDTASEPQLLDKLAAYREFAAGWGNDFASAEQSNWSRPLAELGGCLLRAVGFNTVLFCDKHDSLGNLIVNPRQYARGLKRTEGHEVIALGHHPIEWLKNRKQIEDYICSRCRVLLVGHEHKWRIKKEDQGAEFERLEIGAGAVSPAGSLDAYCFYYNWLTVSITDDDGTLHLVVNVKPRRWVRHETAFGSDPERFKPQCESRDFAMLIGKRETTGREESSARQAGSDSSAAVLAEAVALPAEEVSVIEVADMPCNDEPEVSAQADMVQLRRLFWHSLTRLERLEVLLQMQVLAEPGIALTHSLERAAFEKVVDQNRTGELWDLIVKKKGLGTPNSL